MLPQKRRLCLFVFWQNCPDNEEKLWNFTVNNCQRLSGQFANQTHVGIYPLFSRRAQPTRRCDFPESQFKAVDIFSSPPRAQREASLSTFEMFLLCDRAHSLCAHGRWNTEKKKIYAQSEQKAPAVAASLHYCWSLVQSPWQPRVWFSSSLIWRQLESGSLSIRK